MARRKPVSPFTGNVPVLEPNMTKPSACEINCKSWRLPNDDGPCTCGNRQTNTPLLTNDEIIDWRDNLIAKRDHESLTVTEQNLLRDCDIALGLVRCKPETREEARSRVSRMVAERGAP